MDNPNCIERPGPWSLSARLMTLACLIVFMAQMATTVYLPSLPVVMSDLAMTRQDAELSISLFVIGAALPLLFWGAAADRYGRRLPLVLSLLLFVGISLLLATTSQGPLLLVLRTLQGIAAGGATIIARILIRDHWQGDELARRLSVLSIAFITALGGGQWIGGLISRYAHWQLGFVLVAAVGMVALALMIRLPLQGPNAAAPTTGMWRRYASLLQRPGFLWPACAGGLGFAITVTLQEISPFVLQQGFELEVTTFGALGLLIGVAYFAGAMAVNRQVARVGGKRLMRQGAGLILLAAAGMVVLSMLSDLQGEGVLVIMMGLYCLIIFGQAVLFPNSMALAVSDAREHGAYAMALCGFLQQGLAGIAAAGATLLSHHGTWAPAIFALALVAALIVRFRVR
ncbi:MFS transporter [Aeromonas aquatica]|uniref:MFS transporter n=1 Tax=Aeromonas aquatica TaxID=558964 RepID=UPI00051AFC8B|nr:MFS transporter [Aeromonas aquatica]